MGEVGAGAAEGVADGEGDGAAVVGAGDEVVGAGAGVKTVEAGVFAEGAGDFAVGEAAGVMTGEAGGEAGGEEAEPAAGAAPGAFPEAAEHWLIDGVLTLQALGRARARVRLIGRPSVLFVLRTWQRQSTRVETTVESAVQHSLPGVVSLLPLDT